MQDPDLLRIVHDSLHARVRRYGILSWFFLIYGTYSNKGRVSLALDLAVSPAKLGSQSEMTVFGTVQD